MARRPRNGKIDESQENSNGDVENARQRRRIRQSAKLKPGEPSKIARDSIEHQEEFGLEVNEHQEELEVTEHQEELDPEVNEHQEESDLEVNEHQKFKIEKDSNVDVENTENSREKGVALNAPNLASNNPMRKTLVANQHTADIIFPRSYPRQEGEIHGKPLESLKFLSGTVTPIDAEIWESVKRRNRMVGRYLELGLLAETQSTRETGAFIERTANLKPPEHLLSDEEGKTRIERETVSQAQL